MQKDDTMNFCLFAKLQRQNQIFVSTNSATKFTNEPFLRKMLISFFSSNIPLYIEKLYWKKHYTLEELFKVLEMELKKCTPVVPKFVSEKSNLRFCIIFNMIVFTNAQGSVKTRLACSKVL